MNDERKYCRWRSSVIAAAMLISSFIVHHSSFVFADTLWVSSGGGAIQIANAKITRIEKDQIFFITAGREASRELNKVQRLNIDGEPALNAAEDAFAAGKWDQSVDGYQRLIAATNKPWIKDWSSARLLEAGGKSGRFDAAATAYVNLIVKDPAAAAKAKPPAADGKSPYMDAAIASVNGALSASNLSDEQRAALLTFLVDLHRARKDTASEEKVSAKLDEVLAKDPAHPAAGQAAARRTLQSAERALAAKDFRKVITEIESNRSALTDPQQQADALWYLAEARNGLAQSNSAKDRAALQDAALAYMRVVAHFGELPGKPHVAESLMKTAAIEEQLGAKPEALALYQQIAQQFSDDPVAATAKQNAQRLSSNQ